MLVYLKGPHSKCVRGRGDRAKTVIAELVAKGLSLLKPAQLPVLVYLIQFMHIAPICLQQKSSEAPHKERNHYHFRHYNQIKILYCKKSVYLKSLIRKKKLNQRNLQIASKLQ